MTSPPETRTDLRWLAVDFDGTLARNDGAPNFRLSEPIYPNIEKLDDAAHRGWKIVIHTARPWSDYELIEWWLNLFRVPFNRIVCGKLLAAAYIDDRNISIDADSWVPCG